jgi:RNA polymerase sigma-70 factor (ECF subfamily)
VQDIKQQGSGQLTEPADGRIDAATLFRAHASFVAAFLRRLGVLQSELDDLVQEVFLVAHRKGGYVPGAGQPRTWLAAIAFRVASSGRRSQARRRETYDETVLAQLGSSAADPADALEARRSLLRVQQALEALDLEHRAAFVLYEIEGEACSAIAVGFGIPVGTVYSRLHHARRRFLEAHAALCQAGQDAAQLRRRESA